MDDFYERDHVVLAITQYYTKRLINPRKVGSLIVNVFVLRFLYCYCANTNFNIVNLFHTMHPGGLQYLQVLPFSHVNIAPWFLY